MSSRYVVLGAALPRSAWFPALSQWANAGAIPVELVKCISADEVSDRVRSRTFSAVIVDGGLPGLDRDTFAAVRQHGGASIVVRAPQSPVDWVALGANAVLDPDFDRAALLDALAETSTLVRRVEHRTASPEPAGGSPILRAQTIAVVGAGGVGSSTVAMAIAEAFGREPSTAGRTVLADFSLAAELAMLHDTRRIAPGLQELVDLHRNAIPEAEQVRELCFGVDARGYDLLVGLRRRRLWTTLRTEACTSAIDSLTQAYAAVIFDTDADLEGEAETGAIDVEERNLLARSAVRSADRVVAVGHASLKGLHSLTRVISDLLAFGVQAEQLAPVINCAPGAARARAGYTAALAELLGSTDGPVPPPRFVPFRNVDECIRAVSPLPRSVVEVFSDLASPAPAPDRQTTSGLRRILPGSLARAGASA